MFIDLHQQAALCFTDFSESICGIRSGTSCPVLGVALEGFLKRIRIGDDVKYNLEFKLPSISEQLH
jgi:hypothetical protein